MDEIWRVTSRDHRYEVSNLGRVRRITPDRGARVGFILRPIPGGRHGQYRRIGIGKNGPKVYIHQLVAEAFIGARPTPKHEVNHIDGNTVNNAADNLEWVSRASNMTHAYQKLGRLAHPQRGEDQWHSKLTAVAVTEIRRLWVTRQYTQAQLGKLFGIHQGTVSGIVLRETWKHV